MTKYKTSRVQEFLNIYGDMVHQSNVYEHGVIVPEHKTDIKKTIVRAKQEFPEELKDEKFKLILSKLEGILKNSKNN